MRSLLSPSFQLLAPILALALSACASQRETMTSAYRGAEVVSSGPIAADDAAMKQKPGTVKTKRTASSTSSKSNGTDTEMNSTETTTVVGASAVAAPDSEVKFNQ